jgi:hypothetical protein
MDKIKPYEQVALRFQISRESAKYFLNHVQKSFKRERPPHQLILEFIEMQQLEFLPTPYETATLMNEAGAWPYALGTPPPAIINDEEIESD